MNAIIKTKTLKDRLSVKAGLVAAVQIFLILMIFSIYNHILLFNDLRTRLTIAASEAAISIDGDSMTKLQSREDEQTPEYKQLKQKLQQIRDANKDIRFVYIMVPTEKKNILKFVVDAEEDPKFISHIGDEFDISPYPEMQKSFQGPSADKSITKDEWGYFISGYAPIYNSKGRVIGIVGLDMSLRQLLYHMSKLTVFAVFLLIAGVLWAMYKARKVAVEVFNKPLTELINHTEEISKGNLDKKIELNSNDEFDILANSFNTMAEKLHNTQNELVQEAQRAIDQKEHIFQIYRDVIYSVTQGKLSLTTTEELLSYNSMVNAWETIKIDRPEDVNKARKLAEKILQKFPEKTENLNKILLVISEAVTNAIRHAQKGTMRVGTDAHKLIVIVQDEGPGMDFAKLPHMIFLKGFSTKQSMGCGFSLIYAYSDKIHLCTTEMGTTLVLEFELSEK